MLPPNWHAYTTEDGTEYYYNTVTQLTQWQPPVWPGSLDTAQVYKPEFADIEISARPESVREDETTSLAQPVPPPQSPIPAKPEPVVVAEEHSVTSVAGLGIFANVFASGQQLFDVNTEDVKLRLRLSLLPFQLQGDSADNVFRARPDFWGPLWIATTVALLMPVTGNFDLYMSMTDNEWDELLQCYNLLTIAVGMVYGSLLAVPVTVRAIMMFCSTEEDTPVDFRHLTCVYGYSFTSVIPVSVLCLVPFALVRWIAVLMGLLTSLCFVKVTFWNDFATGRPWLKWLITAVLATGQAIIFATYRIYFFSIH
jgi:hypothetical protein